MTSLRAAPYIVALEPGENVRRDGGRFVAHSGTPWLNLRFADGVPAGRWISLAYRSSYFDALARPIVRLVTPDGHHDRMAPAALFGRAAWIGYVPDGTSAILISPVDSAGPFGFEIESCRQMSRVDLLTEASLHDPARTLEAIAWRCIGRRQEAHRLLHAGLGAVRFERYHEWRTGRLRAFDPHTLDAPRTDWSIGPHICIVATTDELDPGHMRGLLDQCARQAYPRWSLVWVSRISRSRGGEFTTSVESGRLRLLDPDDAVAVLCDAAAGEILVGSIDIDDILPPFAFAVLAEQSTRQPTKSIFYGDEDAIDASGRYVDPRLYPDWSPTFEAMAHYVGSALFVRSTLLAQLDKPCLGHLVGDGGLKSLLSRVPGNEVEHIRRVLLTRRGQPHRTASVAPRPNTPPAASTAAIVGRPRATIVIPSKDRADLLSACLRGLAMTDNPGDLEVIIVDNGSLEPNTRLLYDSLATDERIRVIDRPGPFNFSLLCNEAARAARAPILVFLNNDTEPVDGSWLRPLLSWASRPDIGAVGAKLLYPSGRLQHGGVVLGVAGSTAHIDRDSRPDDPGYLRRRAGPHELSAVTAACLAVEKAKFDAVGGFDAQHLPIELNDIDLCLRLSDRGWRTIFTPESVLVHHESASRGRSTARSEKYQRERSFFRDRWGSRLRDDPYFHPSLSLLSIRTALG